MIDYLIIWLVAFGLAGWRDVDKERHKKEFGTIAQYHEHSNHWHFQTASIMIVIVIAFAVLLQDWRILLIGFATLTIDAWYYVFKKFIHPFENGNWFPDHLNWFVVDWDSKWNPIVFFFGRHFSRVEFIVAWVVQTLIVFTALYFLTLKT